jgi:NAD(P)-dependent dehydrogenase (short-subunit alcohol dehydrogenase family)
MCRAGPGSKRSAARAMSDAGAPPCMWCSLQGPRASSVGTKRSPSRWNTASGISRGTPRQYGTGRREGETPPLACAVVADEGDAPPRADTRAGLLDGKVALITGGASGQGRAAALLFAAHGAAVALADLDDEGADVTCDLIEDSGGDAMPIHADVSLRIDCDRMVATAIGEYQQLDILYNNAAIQMSGRLIETTEDQWDITIATNLSAIFWTCRAAVHPLGAGDGGSVINTASVLGLIGSEGYAAYGASKAGLVAFTRQFAVEHGPEVRANVIAPGSIDTPRFRAVAEGMDDPDGFVSGLEATIPLHRLGVAGDVAGIALFLASDLSAYVSGAVIPCDGGLAALR